MTVLYRCAEDNNLCMAECESIYIDENTVYLNLRNGSRHCKDIPVDRYESIMKSSIGYRSVDFSDYLFTSDYDSNGNYIGDEL